MSQQYTNWANHNVLTFTGRVMDAHLIDGQYGEALSVTMISTLEKDGNEITVQFINKNGLMTMFKNGNLVKGMTLTVTGHISKVEGTYVDKKDGQTKLLTRPRLTLKAATVFDGGVGPKPKKEVMPSTPNQVIATTPVDAAPPVDPTPSSEEIPF